MSGRPPITKYGAWLIGPPRGFRGAWNSTEVLDSETIGYGSAFMMHAWPDPAATSRALWPAIRVALLNRVTYLRLARVLLTYVGGACAAAALTRLIATTHTPGPPSTPWTLAFLVGVGAVVFGELANTTADLLVSVVLPRFTAEDEVAQT